MTEPCGRLDSGERMDEEFEALVNIGGKPIVPREATAEGFIRLQPATLDAIREGDPLYRYHLEKQQGNRPTELHIGDWESCLAAAKQWSA